MSIYKVVLNGGALGVQITNVLYYRTGIGIDIAGLAVGGCKELAEGVARDVWPKLKVCLPNTYKLENISVFDYDNEGFMPFHQNPYTLNILENGTLSSQTDGTAQVVIFKFNLEPSAMIFNGFRPPKRGYLAIGPLDSAWISNTGHIDDAVFVNPTHALAQLGTALSANIANAVPPVIFYPIRVKTDRVLNTFRIVSWADVGSASMRRLTSYRRSRMAER